MLPGKALICAKVETTYGVDASPSTTTDAILTGPVKFQVLTKKAERKVVLPYFGQLNSILIGEGVKLSFSVEIRASGVLGTAPRIGALMRAYNFTQTITAGTKVDYDPNSSQDGESVTIYFYQDGQLFKTLGNLGTSMKLNGKTNEIASLDLEFTGMWGGPASITDTAFPSSITYGDSDPLIFAASVSVDSYAGILDTLEFTLAPKLAKRANANSSNGVYRYSATDRALTGSWDPEVVSLSTFNPWVSAFANAPGAVSATLGTTAGKKCIITMPGVVKDDAPGLGDREGIATYSIPFKSNPTLTAGNNEIKFSFQ
ncbi:MAG: phage tail tube protein [Thermodesulfovibrionales bacterium]|jgi:hypothetical protein